MAQHEQQPFRALRSKRPCQAFYLFLWQFCCLSDLREREFPQREQCRRRPTRRLDTTFSTPLKTPFSTPLFQFLFAKFFHQFTHGIDPLCFPSPV